MKLTKKFIKENEGMTLKEAFPEVFESDFTGWAKDNNIGNEKWIGYVENDFLMYGIGASGEWFDRRGMNILNRNNIPATPQEIQEALEKEAVRREYKENVRISRLFDKELQDCSIDKNIFPKDAGFFYNLKNDYLEHFGFVIYSKGQWAQIIPTITKQEAEERLGMKII